eukprot:4102176-Pleurochrysis_carterae.AAC.1
MAMACIHRVRSEYKVKHDPGPGRRYQMLLFATICLSNSRSLACAQWLCLARAHNRVRMRRLVFEIELTSAPYKPTQA